MANRIVYYGPFNNGKKDDLFHKALESLKNGEEDRFYYLLPNGELLKNYRKKFIDKVEKTFEINLFTFDNVVKNILKDEFYLTINSAMKDLIIKEVMDKLNKEGKILYYKDFISMDGFIGSLSNIIGEIKRSLIYPKDYLMNCSSSPLFTEVGLIYNEYEETLKKLNLIDREGEYFKGIEGLKDNKDYFKGLDYIIIDEFYDFRPIEIEIIKELCKLNIDIYINIPFKMKSDISNLTNTLSILKELGFQEEKIEKNIFNFFETLGFNFFSDEGTTLDYDENLTLIKSPSIYLEFKRIFEEIKRIRKSGIELSQMAIILLNEEYKDILFQVALEEKTPLDLRQETPLVEIPLIIEFLNIIQMKIDKGSKQNIINRIKSNYFRVVDKEYEDGLEFVLRRLNFNNLLELEKLLEEEKTINISMDYFGLIRDVISVANDELNTIPVLDSILNYNQLFFGIIDDFKLEESLYNRYALEKDYDLLYRDVSALEKLKETIDRMKQISLIVEEISIEDYYQGLKKLIEEETILDQEENPKGIKILNPINSRGLIYQVVFITGLSKAYYPLLQENNFFINDVNQAELKKIGLDYKNYHERLDNEAIKFSSLISSCKDRLYLSYSEGLNEDSIPSMFLEEILSMINGEELKDKLSIINIGQTYLFKNQLESITTIGELSNYLIFNHHKDLSDSSKEYYSFFNQIDGEKFKNVNDKIFCEYKRHGEFNEYKGYISKDDIVRDLNLLHENKIYSNTYLEAYGRCPYYFLLNKILYVEEMERFFQEYSPIDVGIIYHEVLRHYYHTHRDDIAKDIEGGEPFLFEDTEEYLRTLVMNYSMKTGLNPKLKSNMLIIDNTYDLLREFIKKDLYRMKNSKEKLVPYAFEVEFGSYNDFSINVQDEEIKLAGKIDRIDKVLNEEKYVVMDYKSSSYGIYDVDKMSKGLSLQLPIYILSQKDKKVVAGVYGILSKGEFEFKLGNLEETKLISSRNKGALDTEGWDMLMETVKTNIKEIRDKILKGDFSVNPLECSPYCIYKDICRYENVLEVE